MTDADKREFMKAIACLCVALREKEPDVVQMRVYFEALKDLEIEFVVAGAKRLERYAPYGFPKTSDWHDAAELVQTERRQAQRALLQAAAAPLCVLCEDTGWERVRLVERGRPVVRARRCACQKQRKQELLGRAPIPALPQKPDVEEPTASIHELVKELAQQKAMP